VVGKNLEVVTCLGGCNFGSTNILWRVKTGIVVTHLGGCSSGSSNPFLWPYG
jgi:hypothetical protein